MSSPVRSHAKALATFSGEPATTRVSPGKTVKSSAGAGLACSPRTTATTVRPTTPLPASLPSFWPAIAVVVVHREPVDRETGDLVEPRERLGDLRAAEQLGEGVRLVFVEPQRHLLHVGAVLGVGERDEIAVTRAVGDHADLAAVIRDEGVQHPHPWELDPTNIDHGETLPMVSSQFTRHTAAGRRASAAVSERGVVSRRCRARRLARDRLTRHPASSGSRARRAPDRGSARSRSACAPHPSRARPP